MSEAPEAGKSKVLIVVLLVAAIAAVLVMRSREEAPAPATGGQPAVTEARASAETAVPTLVELGSKSCIPCKMMEPIIAELTVEYAGRMRVIFIDVWKDEAAGKQYAIRTIPTQVFLDAEGKELFRHEGFFAKEQILAKWAELGVTFAEGAATVEKIERWEPAAKDSRTPEQVCSMCDGTVADQDVVVVQTDKGAVRLCGLHCYFIMYSCLMTDKTGFEDKVSVADALSGKMVPIRDASFVRGADAKTSRPWIKAFASRDDALAQSQALSGSMVAWEELLKAEMEHLCAFCDRACYPQDVAEVLIDGETGYGCCAHCAMGVAARTGKDIEVRQPDGLTGEPVIVKTSQGSVASIEPKTAVAWYGKKKNVEGKWVSAGCFHQGFFATPENLRQWLDRHPLETGEMITIAQSLADKMKLSPQQIMKACKIGECAPK